MNRKNVLIAIVVATISGVLVNVVTKVIFDTIPIKAETIKQVPNNQKENESSEEKIHKTFKLSCKGALLQIGCSRNEIVKEDCPLGWERSRPKPEVITPDGGNGWAKWLNKDNKSDCSLQLHIGTGQYSSRKTVVATVHIKKK